MLEVSAARHSNAKVLFGSGEQDINQLSHQCRDVGRLVEQIGANQSCNLVVATAAGANFSAEFGTRDLDESSLECAVDVLIGFAWLEGSGLNASQKFDEVTVEFLDLWNR